MEITKTGYSVLLSEQERMDIHKDIMNMYREIHKNDKSIQNKGRWLVERVGNDYYHLEQFRRLLEQII